MHDSWMSPKTAVRESRIQGRGIFAVAEIAAGERILLWGGPSYTDRAGAERARRAGRFVMRWDEDVYSRETEAPDQEEPFLINHSCDPNAWMEGAFAVVARRAIPPGEEVTMDYALFSFDGPEVVPAPDSPEAKGTPCRCGSPLCRGAIRGSDWRRPELRARYRGRFSPYLNRRIADEEAEGSLPSGPPSPHRPG